MVVVAAHWGGTAAVVAAVDIVVVVGFFIIVGWWCNADDLMSMTARKAEAAYKSCRAVAGESFIERFNRKAMDGLPYPQTQTLGPQLAPPPPPGI